MRSIFAAILLVATMSACGSGGATQKSITVVHHGVTYVFPKEHINASVIPPEGRLYVRLSPPASDFHLVLDEWGDRPSHHGPTVPHISRLSDRFGKFSVTQTADGPVVCDLGPQPHFNCGFRLDDGPVKWGVLFDNRLIGQAGQIRERANRIIETYKSSVAT